MGISEEKQKKLAYVARRYYLDDWKQSDIAKELGVSRPLISRMLTEAREHGVVEIRIHDPAARPAGGAAAPFHLHPGRRTGGGRPGR